MSPRGDMTVEFSAPVATRVVSVERPRRPQSLPPPARQTLLPAAMYLPGPSLPDVVPIRGTRDEPRDPLAGIEASQATPQGPGWAGVRLEIGAGQAPYDDAPSPNALLPIGTTGFSDSLMRLVIEEPVGGGISLLGSLAASRYQDEPILDGLRDSEFAWISFGIQFRF